MVWNPRSEIWYCNSNSVPPGPRPPSTTTLWGKPGNPKTLWDPVEGQFGYISNQNPGEPSADGAGGVTADRPGIPPPERNPPGRKDLPSGARNGDTYLPETRDGLDQGNPLAAPLFCMTMQKALKTIRRSIDRNERHRIPGRCLFRGRAGSDRGSSKRN